jgi:hypothetical protein
MARWFAAMAKNAIPLTAIHVTSDGDNWGQPGREKAEGMEDGCFVLKPSQV